jgi:frataxin-like iron-binding protein CyaY
MKHIKTYEGLFGFGSKNQKTWQDRFNDIYNFYIKNKNKDISIIDIPTADVKKNEVSISQGLDNHLVFYGQTGLRHNWKVLDFSEVDYADIKSTKGVYPITPEIYEEYKKKIQEISDWLDERSEKSSGKSNSIISNTGDINLDFDELDLAIEEMTDKIKSELKVVGKEYKFEISYKSWTSNSSNVHVVERRKLKITDIKFGFGGSRFWCELFTKGAFNEPTYLWIESDSSYEYYDLEKNKWPYNRNELISMDIVKKEMTRKEQRDYDNNREFPYAISYEVTPCEYKSIELIKDITQILVEMNLGLKK